MPQTTYTPDLSTLGKRLSHWLIDTRTSQTELAEKIGVSPASISRWCLDNGRPELDFLPVLAQAVGFSLEYLLCGPAESTPSTSSMPPTPDNPEAKP